ncbi:MAG: hypothetical protein AB8B97_04085 [Granulosicoccus sp.]
MAGTWRIKNLDAFPGALQTWLSHCFGLQAVICPGLSRKTLTACIDDALNSSLTEKLRSHCPPARLQVMLVVQETKKANRSY